MTLIALGYFNFDASIIDVHVFAAKDRILYVEVHF
jgi:hypothetical protein